jgi:hypothetical protein
MRELIDLKAREPLRDPVLIAGHAVRRRGGRSAGRAMDWLAKAWNAEPVAELESDVYLDLTIRRPDIDFGPDKSALTWPDAKIYLAHAPNSTQDLLLLGGFEPHFFWKQYCEQVGAYADALGVKTLVCIRSFPSDVPHTRPAPMLLRSSDIDLELQFGVQAQGSRYQGPTDISGVLAAHVQNTMRWKTVDLTVLQPQYFPRMPNSEATLAVVRVLDKAFGTQTDMTDLVREAQEQLRTIDQSITDAGTRAAIVELERQYDAAADRMDFLTTGPAPDDEDGGELATDDVFAEVERLLRGGGDPKPPAD